MSWVQFEHAPPRSWDQFEELCADTFQEEWQDAALVRHGRAGQAQHGVDIVGRHGAIWPIGIQCKRKSTWPVTQVTTAELDAEVDAAKAFLPPLKIFYLVSTAPDDRGLQEHARLITERHEKDGLFRVEVLGWREVERRATRHHNVAAKHFGAYSNGAASPLLATWRSASGALPLTDRELAIAIREVIHDLRQWPSGRVVFRQQESEDLLQRINEKQAEPESLDRREAVLDLRDELKRLRDREASVINGLMLLLGHEALRDYVRFVWTDYAPLLVRSFVEQAVDAHRGVITGLNKIRLYAPGVFDEDSVALYIPQEATLAIWDRWKELKSRFPDLNVKNVEELPPSVKFRYAVPEILRQVLDAMCETELEALIQKGWLQLHRWRVEA